MLVLLVMMLRYVVAHRYSRLTNDGRSESNGDQERLIFDCTPNLVPMLLVCRNNLLEATTAILTVSQQYKFS